MSANSELLDEYVELYNAGDLDGVMDLYAEDATQLMPEGLFEGRAAIRERLDRDLEACPDIAWGVESFVEQLDAFSDEWSFVATHTDTGVTGLFVVVAVAMTVFGLGAAFAVARIGPGKS